MSREIKVSFTAAGTVKQIVRLNDDCGWSTWQIAEGLAKGTLATTIQENGDLAIVLDGSVLGKVVDVDNELEYDCFEVEVAGRMVLKYMGGGTAENRTLPPPPGYGVGIAPIQGTQFFVVISEDGETVLDSTPRLEADAITVAWYRVDNYS